VSTDDMSWNNANFTLQAALTHDPGFQGQQLGNDGAWLVVVEPGRALNASSLAEIENARRIRRIEILQGVTPKLELDRAREAVEAAMRTLERPTDFKGLGVLPDWARGKLRLFGDVEYARAVAAEAHVEALVEVVPGLLKRV